MVHHCAKGRAQVLITTIQLFREVVDRVAG